jgi:nucleotide-binding universal stress UspA family protein
MSYRTILVDLCANEPVEQRLTAARSLARRFDAALVGMHVVPPPFVPTMWEGTGAVYLPVELIEAERAASMEAKERIHAAFERLRNNDPSMSWLEADGLPALVVPEAAHAADLVVTAREPGGGDSMLGMSQALILGAGVPVLVLPQGGHAGELGSTVLIAWNGSREAARAVHDALPFLQASERPVVLCAIGEGALAGLDRAVAMLERHKVRVRPEQLQGAGAHAGEILLAQAVAHEADLLVMGAYGHSRLRELILGGATRHVLRHATLPVLFSS